MTFLKRMTIAAAAALLAGSAHAQTFSDAFAGFGSNDGEPIEIEASELRVEDNNNTATFVGDVLVTQGETSLKTQRLKVFYVGSGLRRPKKAPSSRRFRSWKRREACSSPPRTRPRRATKPAST